MQRHTAIDVDEALQHGQRDFLGFVMDGITADLKWLWPQRLAVAAVAVLALLTAGLEMAEPLFMRFIVDRVLLNTGIAHAADPVNMARAMKAGIEAGRLAYLSGRIPKKLYATASSPDEGIIAPARPR